MQRTATKGMPAWQIMLITIAATVGLFAGTAADGLAEEVPASLEAIIAEDGSAWERVSEPGFGNKENLSIVALCPFQGSLYAATRNESSGFELWRTQGTGWQQVIVPGFTDSTLHAYMNNGYGDMVEFNGHLYVGISSGYEGAFLYGSMGYEIWRFDGNIWEPVVSNSRDADEAGAISAIADCSADDADPSAEITDANKTWAPNQWQDGILRITSGQGTGRVFRILKNTATTLTVQQNEEANTEGSDGQETEYTICDETIPDQAHPALVAGAIAANDTYEIGLGDDENGFGQMWNKTLIDLEVFNDELYISTGHNYEAGTRVWKSADGLSWAPCSDYSFGLLHGFDLQGNETGVCLIDNMEDTVGNPVCSSSTHFGISSVSGVRSLYLGGTGSSGCNGRGARVVRQDGGTWNFIVDNYVDQNDTGTNENGFGVAGSFAESNFQAWSWAEFDNRLFVGVARIVGARIMYTATGSADDGAWTYVVGADGPMPDGFDGVAGFVGYGANIGAHLFTFRDVLYAGTLVNAYSPPLFSGRVLDGADLWRATGTSNSLVWSRVTADGFGDPAVLGFESFCTFGGSLYVAASDIFGNFGGDQLPGAAGAKVYRLKEVPRLVRMSSFTGTPGKTSVTLNWATDNETDCSAFNVYWSLSEKTNQAYKKIQTIAAQGSAEQGGTYAFSDQWLWFNTPYCYKVEAVGSAGQSAWFGPICVTTEPLFEPW